MKINKFTLNVNISDWLYALMELSKNKRSDEFIKLTSNPAQGKGGSSFGDSGGPILLRDTNIILGLVSYGTNYNCAGIEYAARVNTSDVLNWLYTYLLPQYFSIIELKFID